MWELSVETVNDYLIRTHRLGAGESAEVTLLTGGVSNVVFLIAPPHDAPFVLKQSRTQLRTQADWRSRLDRIFREAEAQRALSQLLPDGTVPAVLFEDPENFLYVMSAVRPDHAVWKRQLLSRHIDHRVFAQAGSLLGDIHALTAGKPELLSDAADTTVFFELRVDPFYRRIAEAHPMIRPECAHLIDEMRQHRECLVHADFSPKNLLVHSEGVTLVDYETAHYGDPAFDLGFFFSHLWLKAVALADDRRELMTGIHQAWEAYQSRCGSAKTINCCNVSRRCVRHLAACLLARIDGKSPVEYLTEATHRDFIRKLTLRWLKTPPHDLNDALQKLSQEVLEQSEMQKQDPKVR